MAEPAFVDLPVTQISHGHGVGGGKESGGLIGASLVTEKEERNHVSRI